MPSAKSKSIKLVLSSHSDYVNLIIFLVVFSALIIFIIRPSLVTAFSIAKKKTDLTALNNDYEGTISKIVNLQSDLVKARDFEQVVDDSIPQEPLVSQVIQQVTQAAEQSNISLSEIQLTNQALIYENASGDVLPIELTFEVEGSFPDIITFTQTLYGQKRIKFAPNIEVLKSRTLDSSSSAILKTRIELLAYYM